MGTIFSEKVKVEKKVERPSIPSRKSVGYNNLTEKLKQLREEIEIEMKEYIIVEANI